MAQIERPLRIIVPFAAGTSSDVQARLLALHLAPLLPQPVLVENRAGAGGSVGAEVVARATDGHTILLGSNGPLVNNPILQPRMPYESPDDFAPIGMISRSPLTLTVRAESPIRDVEAISRRRAGRAAQHRLLRPGQRHAFPHRAVHGRFGRPADACALSRVEPLGARHAGGQCRPA
jgi:hypothetical protein